MERYAARGGSAARASARAYHCYCTAEELDAVRREQEARQEAPRYNGRCRTLTDAERAAFAAEGRRPALRLKVPPETIRFDDLIRGEVEFDNALLGDFVIVRSEWGAALPLRGRRRRRGDGDLPRHPRRGPPRATHRSTSPLIRALGYREPVFGHIPLDPQRRTARR